MESPVIVFIDDESAVLNAVKRLLRLSHRDWDVYLFTSAEEALKRIPSLQPWVVVSERELPDMSGDALREAIVECAPLAIRVILTGDTRRETILASPFQAHFMIRKPFDREVLDNLLTRARILHQLPLQYETRVQLGRLQGLPVLPDIYHELSVELEKEEPEVSVVASLIQHDQILVSRVLQLVNSPFFGFGSRTNDIEVAVMRLGLQTIQRLVLVLELYHGDKPSEQRIADALLHDAMRLASQVGVICDSRGMSKALRNQCLVAALLHNIGQLVRWFQLSASDVDPKRWKTELLSEYELVGAYLLELWGFEPEVIDAVRLQLEDPLPDDCDTVTEVLNLALRMVQGRYEESESGQSE
ncbi:HDOD domain-containing protein [Marinobacterium sp. D7]|uniref:HDOD domain-containing protein n=1 Tax=Marinobacterium ramblicola TaxID=2849041 RepID=UPI001C2CCCA7|nr:HDOD domain-containing protein [Marinobacterium ramblicola]MBV1790426.1 HDOD domain-containing protein [Marinobacterium ramblicola]